MKKNNVISWDEYFMGLAHLSRLRSKDPSTQVGCCIVDKNNRVVSIGYNGFPNGCNDDLFPWENQGDFLNTKYSYVVHAELNAILNSHNRLDDCILYVSLFPCNECAKAIIQSGIKKIVYENDKYASSDSVIASKRMLDASGVAYIQLPYAIEINITKSSNSND